MNTIAILPEQGGEHPTTYSAVIADRTATGRTAGEALDALTAQLNAEEAAASVILQQFQPDNFFSAAERDRLSTLMARWRAARESGGALPPTEQAELEERVDEEVEAAAMRGAHIAHDLEVSRLILDRERREQLWVLHEVRSSSAQLPRLTMMVCMVGMMAIAAVAFLLVRGEVTAGAAVVLVALVYLASNLFLVWRFNEEHRRLRHFVEEIEERLHADTPQASTQARKSLTDTGEYGEQKAL